MKKNSVSQSGFFNPRLLLACTLCAVGVGLSIVSFAAPTSTGWAPITSPGTNNPGANGVTCASASDCWAVGQDWSGGSNFQTFIEHWNGTSWSRVFSPNTSAAQPNALAGVACASASDCWAVGAYTYIYNSFPFATPYSQTLIEHWNGTAWTIVASPNTSATENNSLSAVACTSASDCWAVGSTIQHWNGTSWAIVAGGYFNSVTCTSASDCWAVGGGIEHWDGISWAGVTSLGGDLKSVTCAAASECWAVGQYNPGSGVMPLIERWDGTSWAMVASPFGNLNAVTCASASECWVVGDNGEEEYRAFIAQWNGSSWSAVGSTPAPDPNSLSYLNAVTCASASQCWAVGSYFTGSGNQTFIAQYTSPVPPLTAVVSRMTHGTRPFDIDLPLSGTRGIECRSGVGGVSGNYSIVFTFVNTLQSAGAASVSSGTGTVSSSTIGPNPNQYTVNLTNVITGQYIAVTLNSVLDVAGNTGDVVSPQMGVLVGDTTADGFVNSADISQTKSQSGQAVTTSNFREDVTVDGSINSADISFVKSKSGTALP